MHKLMYNFMFIGITVIFLSFVPNQNANALEDEIGDIEVLSIYSSKKEESMRKIFDKFTKETDIQIKLLVDDAPKLIERLEKEGRFTFADIFIASDVRTLEIAKEKGLIRDIYSSKLNRNIPENMSDEDGKWYGLSKRARVIFYAKDKVKPEELSTYEDLANPKWGGKILISSSKDIYNKSLLASLIKANGKDAAEKWARGLVSNFARNPQGSDIDQLRALANGKGDIAIANGSYYLKLLTSDNKEDRKLAEKIGIFFPNQDKRGAHINISGGGIVTHSLNIKNAIKLLDFLAHEESQEFYVSKNYEFPVVDDIAMPSALKKWKNFKMDEANISEFSKYIPDAEIIAKETGWN
ncbi:extracellular solute-binding protein [Rickettsiales bacterium]|nr:extracellular solute-binding protein [Rickettsiales bacterium]